MGKSRKRHTRRKRRQYRQVTKHGPSAKPRHRLQSGRTGTAHAKKTPKKYNAMRQKRPDGKNEEGSNI